MADIEQLRKKLIAFNYEKSTADTKKALDDMYVKQSYTHGDIVQLCGDLLGTEYKSVAAQTSYGLIDNYNTDVKSILHFDVMNNKLIGDASFSDRKIQSNYVMYWNTSSSHYDHVFTTKMNATPHNPQHTPHTCHTVFTLHAYIDNYCNVYIMELRLYFIINYVSLSHNILVGIRNSPHELQHTGVILCRHAMVYDAAKMPHLPETHQDAIFANYDAKLAVFNFAKDDTYFATIFNKFITELCPSYMELCTQIFVRNLKLNHLILLLLNNNSTADEERQKCREYLKIIDTMDKKSTDIEQLQQHTLELSKENAALKRQLLERQRIDIAQSATIQELLQSSTALKSQVITLQLDKIRLEESAAEIAALKAEIVELNKATDAAQQKLQGEQSARLVLLSEINKYRTLYEHNMGEFQLQLSDLSGKNTLIITLKKAIQDAETENGKLVTKIRELQGQVSGMLDAQLAASAAAPTADYNQIVFTTMKELEKELLETKTALDGKIRELQKQTAAHEKFKSTIKQFNESIMK
jgi:PAS domain-containing protein